jgi:GMP synthase (glutamine-hydrolysing)
MTRPHVMVIDPAVKVPELECFNHIAQLSPLPVTYHLPCMQGLQSLHAEDMSQVRGIMVLGSAASVNERLPWQDALEKWLMPHLQRRIPTLGLCYGHQMLAYMFGGEIGYVFPDQRKHKGFREIYVDGTAAWPRGMGKICVSHCETVRKVPESMSVMAKSAEIAVDGLAHKELPVYSFQSHPEAVPEFLKNHDIPDGGPGAFAYGYELVQGFLKFAAGNPR